MLLIDCPHCGPRAQAEFVYERTLDSLPPQGATAQQAMEALFTRTNPRGVDEELWRHSYGCRAWMVVSRHRVSNAIEGIRAIGPEALP